MREIERSILSTAILYEDLRYLIFGELQEVHFTNEFKTVFKEMQKLYKQKQDIDPVIILSSLGQAYTEVIANLADINFIRPNIELYIKKLKDNYSSNMAICNTEGLLSDLKGKRISQEEAQNKYIEISKFFNVNDNRFKSFDMTETMNETFESYYAKENYYRTGFSKIDETVLISPGDYIVIGGKSHSGKTTFATNIMTNMAERNKVVFFSIETNKIKIGNKFISSKGKLELEKINKKSLSVEEEKRFLNTSNELMELDLEIVEAGGMTLNQMFVKALQRQADIIFIDHLQLVTLNASGRNLSMYERITKISNELHSFAQQNKITVFALSQLRRGEPGRKVQEPTMSDLRESGAIEQDADAIFLLYDPVTALTDEEQAEQRKNFSKQKRHLIIAKNKEGRTGKIYLNFYGNVQTFYEQKGEF